MLKFFYRLKRGRGMVLFVVIAVMTLLIAMATTAYFTASSSYKTVVSNYDSSQLYISTTSLADMIIGALTQSTSLAKTEGTTVTSSSETLLNDYSSLKSSVISSKTAAYNEFSKKLPNLINSYGGTEKDVNKLLVGEGSSDNEKTQNLKEKSDALHTAFTEACAAADPVVGYSHNIYAKAGSANVNDFLQEAAKDPVAAGIVDGVKITIQLKNMDFETEAGKVTGRYKYYFDVSTTGFYRDNYVTVQDTIYNISGTVSSDSDAPDFDAFFKSTGGSSADSKGERAVILGAQIISDNAYFENSYTIFGEFSGGDGNFYGGITATGSVFFTRQLNTLNGSDRYIPPPKYQLKSVDPSSHKAEFYSDSTTQEARHDWIIKGDLGILHANSHVDLNGNNLYVDGDLIIGTEGATGLVADKVYVNGNIYLLHDTAEITANEIYVGGKIISGKPENLTLDHYVEVSKDPTDKTQREIMTYAEAYPDGTNLKTGYTLLHSSWNTETDTRRAWATVADEIGFVTEKVKEAAAEANKTFVPLSYKTSDSENTKLNGKTIYHTRTDWKGSNVQLPVKVDDNKSTYSQYSTEVQLSNPKAVGDHYEYKFSGKMKIDEVFDEKSGTTKTKDWPIYTANSETLNNVLMIDFTNLSVPTIGVTKGSEGGSLNGWLDGTPTTWKYNVDLPDGSTKEVEGSATLSYTNSDDPKSFQAVYTFPTSNGDGKATVTLQCGDYNDGVQLIADLPYVEKGYQLDLKFPTSWDTQYNRLFKIRTGDNPPTGSTEKYSAMPIVLRANYNDGGATLCDHDTVAPNGDSKKGDNAFSWWGSYNTSNDCRAMVELVDENGTGSAKGSVIFEMGNIDSTGNYNSLDKMVDVVTYTVSQRDFVGTKNQFDDLGVLNSTNFSKEDNVNKILKNGEGKAVDFKTTKDYENRVMLVSNKKTNEIPYKKDYEGKIMTDSDGNKLIDTDKIKSGIVINTTENLFCGYMYGPDTTFVNPDSSSDTVPVLGGLIVAEYVAGKNHYMYAEPDPNIVNAMFHSLGSNTNKEKTPVEGYWYLNDDGIGKNYLG